ncbi:hypothetical protein CYMTET_28783, partial [Cymbomonas tetramitiformis]
MTPSFTGRRRSRSPHEGGASVRGGTSKNESAEHRQMRKVAQMKKKVKTALQQYMEATEGNERLGSVLRDAFVAAVELAFEHTKKANTLPHGSQDCKCDVMAWLFFTPLTKACAHLFLVKGWAVASSSSAANGFEAASSWSQNPAPPLPGLKIPPRLF